MKKVFDSTFTPELPELSALRRNIQLAGETLSKAGPQAPVLIRFIEQVANQIENLERLARPTKKDFGIYSGLVTAVAFAALFWLISWANAVFALSLDPIKLITSCTVVALIAGFGFGALKFRSMLFSWHEKGETHGVSK